jgi:hypothetical protein
MHVFYLREMRYDGYIDPLKELSSHGLDRVCSDQIVVCAAVFSNSGIESSCCVNAERLRGAFSTFSIDPPPLHMTDIKGVLPQSTYALTIWWCFTSRNGLQSFVAHVAVTISSTLTADQRPLKFQTNWNSHTYHHQWTDNSMFDHKTKFHWVTVCNAMVMMLQPQRTRQHIQVECLVYVSERISNDRTCTEYPSSRYPVIHQDQLLINGRVTPYTCLHFRYQTHMLLTVNKIKRRCESIGIAALAFERTCLIWNIFRTSGNTTNWKAHK